MNYRNFFKVASLILIMGFSLPVQSIAAAAHPVNDSIADTRLLTIITNRVAEIQNMDKSQLTKADRKTLKKELREMKKTADGLDKRVYLSVGAIIIIILLLILIL